MRDHALEQHLVERFSITPTEARKMIEEHAAKAAVRVAVARASRGHAVEAKPDADFEQPQVWRHEVHRRLAALDVMEEGIKCLLQLQKHIKQVIEAEQQLVQHKRAKVRDKQVDWWDLRDSGWAMGGRERFATYVGDIFRNLDEGQLGGKVMDRMGFKRSIPLPDIPEPVIEQTPQNADELVAALVGGASRGRRRHRVRSWEDKMPGGLADKKSPDDVDQEQLRMGVEVEMEHVDDPELAKEIAMDHLVEIPDYYSRLAQMEDEADALGPGRGDI